MDRTASIFLMLHNVPVVAVVFTRVVKIVAGQTTQLTAALEVPLMRSAKFSSLLIAVIH
jgi:hypothetical protein